MKLSVWINETEKERRYRVMNGNGDVWRMPDSTGAARVFTSDLSLARLDELHHLEDYAVTGSASGPSLWLSRRSVPYPRP